MLQKKGFTIVYCRDLMKFITVLRFFMIIILLTVSADKVIASCTPSPCGGSCAGKASACPDQDCPPSGAQDCKFRRTIYDYDCESDTNTCSYSCGEDETCTNECTYIYDDCDPSEVYCAGASINCIGQKVTGPVTVLDEWQLNHTSTGTSVFLNAAGIIPNTFYDITSRI